MINKIISQYSLEEKNHKEKISLVERAVFKPTWLYESGVNETITSDKELCFACDREHNNRAKKIINELCNGLTDEELQFLILINKKIADNNKSWFYKIHPQNTLLMHIYQLRLINHLLPESKNILEIGSGSGYLSLLLALKDKTVNSTDVFQPHYIFESFLYSIFNVCNELVIEKNFTQEKRKINHIPWWKFNKLDGSEFECDLLVMNHAICELNSLSLRYILSLTEKLNSPKIFLESTGLARAKWPDIKLTLEKYGYELAFSGNDQKFSTGVYIFEKKTNKKKKRKHIFINKIVRLIPFKFLFNSILIEFRRIFFELILFNRWKHHLTKKIFIQKNKYFYDDIINVYKKNQWDYNNPEDVFFKKTKKKNINSFF